MEEKQESGLKAVTEQTTEDVSEQTVCNHCDQTSHNIHRTKERSDRELKDLLNRLSRIEGQIRGIKSMVEKDVYCTEILMQVAAVTAALNSFNRVLLSSHIKTCVAQDIREGRDESAEELIYLLKKLMK